MRGVPEKLMTALEEGAFEGIKALRAFLAYQGSNKDYERRAKAGAALVTGYTRAFASETNRVAVESAVRRMQDVRAVHSLQESNEPATSAPQ
jgi:hypothetical protein